MAVVPRFDAQVFRLPDQMVVRLNTIVTELNALKRSLVIEDPNSDQVIVHGVQPDNSFGVALWHKQGDNYTLISRIA